MQLRTLLSFLLAFLFSTSIYAQFPSPYCGFNVNFNVEPITYVEVVGSGLSNASSSTINGTPSLENFTHISGTVCPGESYNVLFAGNTDGGFVNDFFVYVDWNDDGTFNQANEQFYLGWMNDPNSNNVYQGIVPIVVPAGAAPGPRRMRIVKKYSDSSHTPCGPTSYGQAEDYTLIVQSPDAPTSIGYTAVAATSAPALNQNAWSQIGCYGSGLSIPVNMIEGVGYEIEHSPSDVTCSSTLTNVYMQLWNEGTTCNGFSSFSGVEMNNLSVIANATGVHRLNISSNICGSTVNATCAGGLGHDFTGQSAALRYKQATTIENTTDDDAVCMGETKDLTHVLGGDHNNPEVTWSIVSGASLGTISGTTFTATAPGTVTIRVTVGAAYDDVTIIINDFVLDTDDDIIICESKLPYTWNGMTVPAGTALGVHNDLLVYATTTSAGCDITVHLNLTIEEDPSGEETISICVDDLPFTWNGQTIGANLVVGNHTNVATYTSLTADGCDSITTLNLIVNPSFEYNISYEYCQDELPVTVHGVTFGANTAAGIHLETASFTTISGCDSIYNITMTINESYAMQESLEICDDELPYTWNNETIPMGTTGTQVFTYNYITVDGCDSIVNLNVTVHPTYYIEMTEYICEGDTFSIAGQDYTQAVMNEIILLQTITGCDSIIDLTLIINDPISVAWDGEVRDLCEGETLAISAFTPNVDNYLWSTGETTPGIAVTQPGIYTVYLIDNQSACNASASVTYIERPNPQVDLIDEFIHCSDEIVTLNGGTDGVDYLWTTGETSQTIDVNSSGTYGVNVTNIYGCETYDEVTLTFYPAPTISGIEATHVDNFRYKFVAQNPQNVFSYHWDFGDGSSSTLSQPLHDYGGPGVYTVFLTITSDCGDRQHYKIMVMDKNVSVEEISEEQLLSVYPNPAVDYLNVDVEEKSANKIESIRVIDMNGRELMTKDINDYNAKVDIRHLSEGIYFVDIQTEDGVERVRFIKTN